MFEDMLRRRLASAAITPSAARNMGKKGLVSAARAFLRDDIDLHEFSQADAQCFARLLNSATSSLQESLSRYLRKGKTGWGPARKFINIYLRDCCYSHHLRRRYQLS